MHKLNNVSYSGVKGNRKEYSFKSYCHALDLSVSDNVLDLRFAAID